MSIANPVRVREAADVAAQRLKALERVAAYKHSWEDAQFEELIVPENRGTLSTPADLRTIIEEKKLQNKLYPESASSSFWQGRGKGSTSS